MKKIIQSILTEQFQPTYLEIQDDSAKHAGHAGAIESGGGHYGVYIVSASFEGLSRVKRHQLIYKALDAYMKNEIHALALKTLTPYEYSDLKM